jgi:hypothetical protein
LPDPTFIKLAKLENSMKKSRPKDGQTLARITPPLPQITLPTKPVAMNSPEYDQLMRQRLQAYFIERQAAKEKQ